MSEQVNTSPASEPQAASSLHFRMPGAYPERLDGAGSEDKNTHDKPGNLLPLAAPRGQQGPLARLPQELTEKVFSHLTSEPLEAQLRLRTVSRAFEKASRVGLPGLYDEIAHRYLWRLLQPGGRGDLRNLLQQNERSILQRMLKSDRIIDLDRLDPFIVQHAPYIRRIKFSSISFERSDQRALFFWLFRERRVTLKALDLSYSTGLINLPEGLEVDGNVDLLRSSMTELPRDLRVSKDIYLHGTAITKIPGGVTVGGEAIFSMRYGSMAFDEFMGQLSFASPEPGSASNPIYSGFFHWC